LTARFFNTLGRRVEELRPIRPGTVSLYTCGPTVYNHVHIGNLRTFLFEDVLCRALRYLGHEVTQVMNLTDVDDKTIRGAAEAGLDLDAFTAPFIESFFADLTTLGVEPAARYPRATAHVAEMIAIIERLLQAGCAYLSEGSVWFRIESDPDYGRLSGFDLDAARQGDRVAQDEYGKEDVRDFVLWKAAKAGEPSWPSPWGAGRPGWHIECSAMSMKYLGETFDVHCGGVDNIFPHHENEIAQSESATGRPFANLWLHAEHLVVDGEKMSKSLGNFYTLKDLVAQGRSPRAIRYLLLSGHYRQKLNFTFASLDGAGNALRRLDDFRDRLTAAAGAAGGSDADTASALGLERDFGTALADDLNLPKALAAVFDFVRETHAALDRGEVAAPAAGRALAALERVDTVLHVLDPGSWRSAAPDDDSAIEALVAERTAARGRRDFRRSDELRAELADRGVVVEDTPRGTVWKRR
jgi:cysteinyl-tRNA synthetase